MCGARSAAGSGCDGRLMRVLVTGAAGFINGYLIPELLEAGTADDGMRHLAAGTAEAVRLTFHRGSAVRAAGPHRNVSAVRRGRTRRPDRRR